MPVSTWGAISLVKCLLVAAAFAAWYIRRGRFGQATIWLGAQILGATIAEGYCTYLSFQGENNLRCYNVYIPLEFVLLGCFGVLGSDLPILRKLSWAGLLAYTVVVVGEFGRAWQEHEFITRGYIVGGLLLTSLFVLVLFREATHSLTPFLRIPGNLVLLGCVVFFGASIPLLGLTNVLIEREVSWAPNMYFINDGLFLIRYGLVIVAAFISLSGLRPAHQ